MKPYRILLAAALIASLSGAGWAQPNPDADSRAISIWSDGTRLAGNLFFPKAHDPETEKLPAIVLCHGWGGVKQHLNATYAPKFAAAGFYVITFDYRGWGESDSRLVNHGDNVPVNDELRATADVQVIREVVDPFGQLTDIWNAINFLEGEPGVDASRIGIWGTSFGGGLAIYTAGVDPRIKCVVSQVGGIDIKGNTLRNGGEGAAELLHQREIARSRGEDEAPMPQGVDGVPGLRGTPHVTEFARYAPLDYATNITAPTLIIDAEHEELFDIREQGEKAYNIIKENATAKYHIEKGIKHYGIYRERYVAGSDMALAWFVEHLK